MSRLCNHHFWLVHSYNTHIQTLCIIVFDLEKVILSWVQVLRPAVLTPVPILIYLRGSGGPFDCMWDVRHTEEIWFYSSCSSRTWLWWMVRNYQVRLLLESGIRNPYLKDRIFIPSTNNHSWLTYTATYVPVANRLSSRDRWVGMRHYTTISPASCSAPSGSVFVSSAPWSVRVVFSLSASSVSISATYKSSKTNQVIL